MDSSYETVELLDIDMNFETIVLYFNIWLQHAVERTVTRENLSPEDLFQLPITAAQARDYAAFLDTDTLQSILHPQSYPPWYIEFMLNHDRLGHLPFVDMFKLVKSVIGVQARLKVSVDGRDDSRVDKNPIYYCLVSCEYVVLRTTYPTYERGDIIPSHQLRGIYTYAILVPICIEILLNTLHYID